MEREKLLPWRSMKTKKEPPVAYVLPSSNVAQTLQPTVSANAVHPKTPNNVRSRWWADDELVANLGSMLAKLNEVNYRARRSGTFTAQMNASSSTSRHPRYRGA